jgi:hypothetical protein
VGEVLRFTSGLMRRSRRPIGAILLAATAGTVLSACWSGAGAQSYANQYWNSTLPYFGEFPGDDCTNYVSASLNAGGLQMEYANQNVTSDFNWWSNGPNSYSHSWTFAQELYNYLAYYEGKSPDINTGITAQVLGAWSWSSYGFLSTPPDQPNPIAAGDVIFYVWDPQNTNYSYNFLSQINHTTLVSAAYGAVSSWGGYIVPQYGTTIDGHSNDRRNEYWTLDYFNTNWAKTIEIEVHIT